MKIIGNITVWVFVLLLSGFVFFMMWGWFIVPLGVKSISIPLALGVSTTIKMLTADLSVTREEKPFQTRMITSIVFNVMILFFGWVYTLFM
jgi:hypothetical protein